MSAKNGTIRRNIYYYDLSVYLKDGDSYVAAHDYNRIIYEAFEYIKKIQEEVAKSNNNNEKVQLMKKLEFNSDPDTKLYIIVDEIDKNILNNRIKYRMVMCRKNEFPYIEKDGKLEAIANCIEGDFSIAEVTHCVIFVSSKILGGEYNFYGARPSFISKYLDCVYPKLKIVTTTKLKNNSFEEIIDSETCSLFELGVRNSDTMKTFLRDEMGMIGNFFNDITDVDVYEIKIMRRKTKKKNGFDLPIDIKNMQRLVSEKREDISTFKISQGHKIDTIDLLSDKLVGHYESVDSENNAIVSSKMYASICNYYDVVVAL